MELPEEGHAAIAELESVQFTYEGGSGPSTVDILFPAQAETIAGATQCIMREHALPCYVETSLHASLTAFANTRAQVSRCLGIMVLDGTYMKTAE